MIRVCIMEQPQNHYTVRAIHYSNEGEIDARKSIGKRRI